MKKFIGLFILMIIFTSCTPVYSYFEDKLLTQQFSGHQLYYSSDFDSLDSYVKIATYIHSKVKYDYSDDPADIKDPEETLLTGKASCADWAVLFANIAYYGMHIKMNFIATNITAAKSVSSGGIINHAALEYNGEVITQYSGTVQDWEIQYIYSFDEVF